MQTIQPSFTIQPQSLCVYVHLYFIPPPTLQQTKYHLRWILTFKCVLDNKKYDDFKVLYQSNLQYCLRKHMSYLTPTYNLVHENICLIWLQLTILFRKIHVFFDSNVQSCLRKTTHILFDSNLQSSLGKYMSFLTQMSNLVYENYTCLFWLQCPILFRKTTHVLIDSNNLQSCLHQKCLRKSYLHQVEWSTHKD